VFKDEQSAGYKPVDAAQNPDPLIRVFLLKRLDQNEP